MPKRLTRLSIFISSPNDLAKEREVIASAIEELNPFLEESHGVNLHSLTFEKDVVPGIGIDPQAVINAQLQDKYDIYIGLLGSRFGSETPRSGSGTAEEFQLAYERYRQAPESVRVIFYFKTITDNIHKLDLEQLKKVHGFRKTLGDAGGLFHDFTDSDSLLKVIRQHLRTLISDQWDGAKWRVLSPLPADLKTPVEQLVSSIEEVDSTLAEEERDISENPGLLDLIVMGETANNVALQSLQSLAESAERNTQEIKTALERLNIAKQHQSAKEMKVALDRLALILLNHSNQTKKDVLALKSSMSESLGAVHSAAKMFSEEKLGDPAEFHGIAEQLSPLIASIRGMREMSDETHDIVSKLPGHTREFRMASRKATAVYAEMSAVMTLLLDRALSTQHSLSKLFGDRKRVLDEQRANPLLEDADNNPELKSE
ncbi:MAG: DUF4062 domain-containing protein [Acidobacteriia bacterium]|nr:DUF4062 domain-containing protein [Terriglobia bacterium]